VIDKVFLLNCLFINQVSTILGGMVVPLKFIEILLNTIFTTADTSYVVKITLNCQPKKLTNYKK